MASNPRIATYHSSNYKEVTNLSEPQCSYPYSGNKNHFVRLITRMDNNADKVPNIRSQILNSIYRWENNTWLMQEK